ncbi:hypothetical protein JG687_00002637 [Phytophthora cactorum]|uniref:Uncharacterized protein n=1 Tax=Phytophthora cactorum TaxID=29920 RepID=A0A8T1UXW2_9STRA|nr:hypothetical protein JG687_00002637 [Phytophthora cactorum]
MTVSDRVWQDRIVPLLDIYATQRSGREAIPADFVIPSETPWPEKAWGIRLGPIVARNVSRFASPTMRAIEK